MARYLILSLEGPLGAYGAEMVDARGPVREWPGASLLTGLIANALGYARGMRAAHMRLQDRLDFAVRIDRQGTHLRDFQTAQLGHADEGWTTRGHPEGRAGGAVTYQSPHIRERDYIANGAVTVALSLRDAEEAPTLDDIVEALKEPARPLFLGRKPCLPSRPIYSDVIEADDALAAVCAAPVLHEDSDRDPHLVVIDRPGLPDAWERLHVIDERNWLSGVHGGERVFRRGRASRWREAEAPPL